MTNWDEVIYDKRSFRIVFGLSVAILIYFIIGVDRLSKLIHQIINKLKSKKLIPEFLLNFATKVSTKQGVTITSIINNGVLHIILVISYECTRPFVKALYGNHEKIGELHGIWIYKFELYFHLLIEKYLQQTLNGDSYMINLIFETIYRGGHFYLSVIVYYLSLLFASRKTKIYYLYMYMIWSSSFTAVIIYALFPCAPPRMIMEAQIDDSFVKILHHQICGKDMDHNGWANCYAAMPSVHSIWCTITVSMALYHCYFVFYIQTKKWHIKVMSVVVFMIFLLYFIMMHVVIMASGHHWISDIFGSWVIMLIYFPIYYRKFDIKNTSFIQKEKIIKDYDHEIEPLILTEK